MRLLLLGNGQFWQYKVDSQQDRRKCYPNDYFQEMKLQKTLHSRHAYIIENWNPAISISRSVFLCPLYFVRNKGEFKFYILKVNIFIALFLNSFVNINDFVGKNKMSSAFMLPWLLYSEERKSYKPKDLFCLDIFSWKCIYFSENKMCEKNVLDYYVILSMKIS